MKKSYFLLPLTLAALFVLGAACSRSATNENTNTAANQEQNANIVPGNDNTNQGTANTNSSGSSTNVNTSTTASGSLTLTKPEKDGTVESPAEVEGAASGSTVTVRVLNTSGKEVLSVPVTVRNGKYHVNLSFAFTNTTIGTIEVAESDGTKVSVPVKFAVASSQTIVTNTNSSDDTNTNASDDTNNSAY